MSLILEALRKSEAERRRGQAPDLLTEPMIAMPRPATGRTRALHWSYALGAAVVALALAWWIWPREGATTAPAVADTMAGADTEGARAANFDSASASTSTGAIPAPIRTPAAGAPARRVAVATPTPTPDASRARSAAAKSTQQDDAREAARGVETASVEDVPSPPLPRNAATRTAEPIDPTPPPPAREERTVAAATPAPASAPAGFSSPDQPLRLSDLSNEERQALPPLKMSMHMFGAEPAQRFAIIDGNRVGEGDRIGDAQVEAIDRTGVTLAWRGRRLRLPIR